MSTIFKTFFIITLMVFSYLTKSAQASSSAATHPNSFGFQSPSAEEDQANEKSPIGDGMYTDVYTFILQDLLNAKSWSLKDAKNLRENEIKNQGNPDLKPLIADIYEGETSGLLRMLCKTENHCDQITLYQKDGVGIATTGMMENIKFKTDRNIDFIVGVLSAFTREKLGTYTYQAENGAIYKEKLKAIYQSADKRYAYPGFKKKNPDDKLIGYVSYLTQR